MPTGPERTARRGRPAAAQNPRTSQSDAGVLSFLAGERAPQEGGFPLRKPQVLAVPTGKSGAWSGTRTGGGGKAVKVTKLVSTCDVKDCPTIYATDRGTFLVQGETPNDHGLNIPARETVVEIPADLILDLVRKGLSGA